MKESRLDIVTDKRKQYSKMTVINNICGHILAAQIRLASVCLSIFVTLSLLSGNAHAAVLPTNKIIINAGGSLNGQDVNFAGATITVNPGEVISGTILISAQSGHPENGLTPIGLNATWGGRADNVKLVHPHLTYNPDSSVLTDITVNFPVVDPLNPTFVAPDIAGSYYIIFGVRSECNQAHVMSATNWRPDVTPPLTNCNNPDPGTGIINPDHSDPIWGDGNDLGWDWTDAQFEQARTTGQITEGALFPEDGSIRDVVYGASWIEVKVVPVPAAIWLFGSGLLGVIAVARRRNR